MTTLETIREFKRGDFRVTVKAVEDFDWDGALSAEDARWAREKIESWELCAFGVEVSVSYRGMELGHDSIWGCIYENPKAFMNHFGARPYARKLSEEHGSPVNVGSYFSDLVREAIAEAYWD